MASNETDISASVGAVASVSTLTLVDATLTTDLNGMRVFDVGQGDCIGLLDQSNDVFLYVDYGGLQDHPDKTNPSYTKVRLPETVKGRLVPIVLTHWDKDHYYSAYKKNVGAKACEWLVPRQLASPQAVRFAATLSNAKCWPESEGATAVRIGVGSKRHVEIRKCKAYDATAVTEDRNVSGLAITLVEVDATTNVAMMILPGDCHFDAIPNLPTAPVRALVAYHHGSKVGWTSSTRSTIAGATTPRAMCYSFGTNSYKHPCRTNYRPDWDSNATDTQHLRAHHLEYQDFLW
jgi:hypothetical protein